MTHTKTRKKNKKKKLKSFTYICDGNSRIKELLLLLLIELQFLNK